MKIENLVIGSVYRQPVDSKIGYEDWEYTGNTVDMPFGTIYAFKNDLGTYWFDEHDIELFEVVHWGAHTL